MQGDIVSRKGKEKNHMRERKRLTLATLALLGMFVHSSAAQAVDAPKWVAVLHVAAQEAVGLRWMPVSGATEYKVLRSTTAGSGYAEIASTAQPQHFDKEIEPGTTYYYVLQAVAGAEVSPNSEEKSVAITLRPTASAPIDPLAAKYSFFDWWRPKKAPMLTMKPR